MNYFSENLRYLRLDKEYTQEQLAIMAGLKRTTIANYENKVSKPDLDELITLANIFGVNIHELLTVKLGGKMAILNELPNDSGGKDANAAAEYVTKKDLEEALLKLSKELKSSNKKN